MLSSPGVLADPEHAGPLTPSIHLSPLPSSLVVQFLVLFSGLELTVQTYVYDDELIIAVNKNRVPKINFLIILNV
jgi:hypothetical protein